MKWPQKLENKKSKIVQATERACCLWIAGGKPFSFALMRRLFWLFGMEIPVQQICKNDTFSSWHGKPSLVPSSVSELSCDSGNTYGDAAISMPSFVFMGDCCNLGLGGLVLVFTVDQKVARGSWALVRRISRECLCLSFWTTCVLCAGGARLPKPRLTSFLGIHSPLSVAELRPAHLLLSFWTASSTLLLKSCRSLFQTDSFPCSNPTPYNTKLTRRFHCSSVFRWALFQPPVAWILAHIFSLVLLWA